MDLAKPLHQEVWAKRGSPAPRHSKRGVRSRLWRNRAVIYGLHHTILAGHVGNVHAGALEP